jgi:hypothetical protein
MIFIRAWKKAALIVMRRYERTSTLLTSNRLVEDWGKLLEIPPPSAEEGENAEVQVDLSSQACLGK